MSALDLMTDCRSESTNKHERVWRGGGTSRPAAERAVAGGSSSVGELSRCARVAVLQCT